MTLTRVTLTLDRQLVDEIRPLSGGNFSRFIGVILEERLDEIRRLKLLEELRFGYESEAAHDLKIAQEFRDIGDEIARQEEF